MTASDFHARNFLKPYQRDSALDPARFVFDLWSRQTGKDFTATAVLVGDCYEHPKTTWLIAAPSERQSLETLAKAREWTELYHVDIASEAEARDGGRESLLRASTIVFANGSRIIAVPGRPQTVRGFSANVLLTEFAFFDDVNETWRALLPSITNPLRGGKKKVRIITTPNGRGNMVHEIWEKNHRPRTRSRRRTPSVPSAPSTSPDDATGKMKWSCRKVTIHDAVREGLDIDIAQLREAMNDPEGFAQEFECEFLDGSNVLLPYDLIAQAESAEAAEFADANSEIGSRGSEFAPRGTDSRTSISKLRSPNFPRFAGIDFGRSNDPTVCWTLERVGDVLWTREVLVLRNLDTPAQNEILRTRMAAAQRVALDYTGPGVGFGDYAAHEFGDWRPEDHRFGKIAKCVFSVPFKRMLFPKLRRAFEAPARLRIPISREIREDLHAMQQVITNGEYNYWAPRTRDGHSDRCTALALAVHAAGDASAAAQQGAFTAQSIAQVRIPSRTPLGRSFQPRRLG